MVRLHEIPQGSKIKETVFNDAGEAIGDTITFHHIDGMYSYCTVDNAPENNNVIHLSAMTPLKPIQIKGEVFYEIISESDLEDTGKSGQVPNQET